MTAINKLLELLDQEYNKIDAQQSDGFDSEMVKSGTLRGIEKAIEIALPLRDNHQTSYELATLTIETQDKVVMYHNWYTDEKKDFDYPDHTSHRTVLQQYMKEGWSHTGIEDRRQINGVLVYYLQREKLD